LKLVYAYDVVLGKEESTGRYHHESFHYEFWRNRYSSVFRSMELVTRTRSETQSASPRQLGAVTQRLQVEGPGMKVRPLDGMSRPWHYFTLREWCKREFREALQGDCVLIARLPSEIGIMGIQTAIEMNKPWMIEMVGHPFDSMWYNGSWYGKAYAPWNRYRIRKLCRIASHVSYVTQHYLQSDYPTDGRALGCSDASLDPITDEQFDLRSLPRGTSERSFKIGLIGTLATRYKGLDTAFRALARLSDYRHVELSILGGGNPEPWRQLAQELGVEDRVRFLGVVPSGKPVRDWLDGLDLYMQPSLTEGLPRGLLEAMSRGVPCLASRVGGIPELLPPERMIEPKDHLALAARMKGLIRDEEQRKSAGFADLTKAREYTEQRLSARWIGFLTEFKDYAANRSGND